MNLRPYQLETVNNIEKGFSEYDRQLAVLPTGAGKTICFSHLAKRNLPRKTLILAHREELIDQAIDKLKQATGIIADKEKAEHKASFDAPVVVGSVQTLMNRYDRWQPSHFGTVVVDEAHHAIAESYQKVLRYFGQYSKVLGVTATPDRGDKKELGSFFENIAHEVKLFDLINDGYLSQIKMKCIPLEIDLGTVRTRMGDFNDSDLNDVLIPYLRSIAKMIKAHASGRKILVFVPLIATSKRFVEVCIEEGINAEHIDGKSEDRKEILARYAAGEIELLSNAMLLTEGFDDPSVDCVVVLRPTQSRALYSQMVGRGTRTAPGKDHLLLLDFLWMHEKHNLIRPYHLVSSCNEVAKIMHDKAQEHGGGLQEELDLENLQSEAQAERERALREKLERNRKRAARFIDVTEFSLNVHQPDVADWEPVMEWHKKPITPKQREIIERNGIDPDTIKGRGHASEILSIIFGRTQQKLATPKQVRFLRQFGHKDPDKVSFKQAGLFLSSRFGSGRKVKR